jgi:hypothetical protein
LGTYAAKFLLLGCFSNESTLYNFSYDSDEIRSPYSNEWIVRSGVGYTF